MKTKNPAENSAKNSVNRVDNQFHLATAAMLFVLATSIVANGMDADPATATEAPALVVKAQPAAKTEPVRMVTIEPIVVRAKRI